jgi:hypothetical protein
LEGGLSLQVAEQVEPVRVGQHQVEQHKIEAAAL